MSYANYRERSALPFLNLQGSYLAGAQSAQSYIVPNVARLQSSHERKRLNVLRSYKDNWDGRGSLAASQIAVSLAIWWVVEFNNLATSTRPWIHPHISLSEDGDVVFEWWLNEKKITIYINEGRALYLKVWGENIDDCMEEGELRRASDFSALWYWLFS
ncbi:hypothetical protein [Methylobacterium sp. E-066]|uniref:hypothetical protein n=1 Tax=Methylobacterium sp. E-066 TaxID=2836584 RepID=UPI001FBBA193|nr:hypothetical protein [Methylobacterium sp. E-066]MCJ2140259.1 hypothetical protein [Methylobacterium sp. E-066]